MAYSPEVDETHWYVMFGRDRGETAADRPRVTKGHCEAGARSLAADAGNRLQLAQQVRQLRDVHRDPVGLVLGQ